ncbi:hypothetical protein, partial [Actimicrobium sp. CCI2.3]|uniref:hypothetical protein n=1 Tax=Actimicrobium sp. CCI2.3 TaxID=3048616 RepID=UPI002B255367
MRRLLTLVVLFSFTVPYTWAAPESFIAREIPTGPVGCEDKGGGVLDSAYKYADCSGQVISDTPMEVFLPFSVQRRRAT